MGYISLDGHETEFDDRTLAHLHLVVINKLRKGQSFAMSWRDTPQDGGGRTSVWVHPNSRVRFHFIGSRAVALNRQWLAQLAESADSSRGLIVYREEGELAQGRGDAHSLTR
ncbi:ATP-dependent DNA ligase [Leifsonia naganoensis]|uniref:DUF7882 domain-containing protein n=1 Tax=Leifsonia naganoensis TaxID=150025 RepID=A0A853DLK5_9MICO|nr:ATP-dependent DNA ligase [Leifsonia naganoensis]NYK10112.1 hypothetical protein [Leifsonia naganoensis]